MYSFHQLVWQTIAALQAVLEARLSHPVEYAFLLLQRHVGRFPQHSPQVLACALRCFSLPHASGYSTVYGGFL